MRVRRTLDVLRPHLRSVGVPLAWLILGGTAWIAATVGIGPAVTHLPPRAQLFGHVAAAMGLTVIASWLALRFRRRSRKGTGTKRRRTYSTFSGWRHCNPGLSCSRFTTSNGPLEAGNASGPWMCTPERSAIGGYLGRGASPVRSFSYASRAVGPWTSSPE